jgi:hypothetical protein
MFFPFFFLFHTGSTMQQTASFPKKEKTITTTLQLVKKPSVVQKRRTTRRVATAASSEWTCSCAATSASRLAYLSQNQTRYGSLAFHPPKTLEISEHP